MYKIKTDTWYIERIILMVAGIVVLASGLLALLVNINWIFVTLFISLMLIIFALTGYCPMAIMLNKFGKKGKCDK